MEKYMGRASCQIQCCTNLSCSHTPFDWQYDHWLRYNKIALLACCSVNKSLKGSIVDRGAP